MAIELNHTIVVARDKDATAAWVAEILGLEKPKRLGPFAVVQVGPTSLDYVDADSDEIAQRHFAFLVSEAEFDEIFGRIRKRKLPHWADPYRTKAGEINTYDDGRGVYFDDPNGHLLEILTRPYGSGGTTAANPNPLILPTIGED